MDAFHAINGRYDLLWIIAPFEMEPDYDPSEPGNYFTYSLSQDELAQLTPGTWKATLKQNLYQWDPTVLLTTWSANITLTVTDTGTQTIFFPSSPASSPVVNLNLNAAGSPGMSTVSGQNSIDMCLYDGSNSSSNRISLLLQDEGAPSQGRPGGQFSVYRDGADKTSPANRIDYAVSVLNPTTGAIQTVQNGNEIIWTNTNARNILRRVSLPGVPGTSLCVPAPLTLTTPPFRLSDKSSGHYSGKLRIVYTPTTQTGS
ncbi:hypothetical protein NG832_14025 [Pantoea stewartii]|nr:hypothetical protein NG832_14025 [Pantoea stewartii]